jgi:hypothetical protein
VGKAGREVAAKYDWKKITKNLTSDFQFFLSKYQKA